MAIGIDFMTPPYPTTDLPMFIVFMTMFVPNILNNIWDITTWSNILPQLGFLYLVYVILVIIVGFVLMSIGYRIGKGKII